MKMDQVAGSGNNEYYTPPYAVTPILKYLRGGSIVWCPFDTEDSHYVKALRRVGHEVIATHITTGHDFFEYTPASFDYIVSNPPYSAKNEVFRRLFDLGRPFAMLVGVVGLFESAKRFSMFRDNRFEIMYFDKRISFFKSFSDQNPSVNPPFSSVYITKDVLPDRVVFETLDKKSL